MKLTINCTAPPHRQMKGVLRHRGHSLAGTWVAQMFLSRGLNLPSPKLQLLQISFISVIEPHTVLGRKESRFFCLTHDLVFICFKPSAISLLFSLRGKKKDKTEARALQLFSSSLRRPCLKGSGAAESQSAH